MVKKAVEQIVRVRGNVEKSFNKLEVGKLWWKNGVMPSVLIGVGVISLRKEDINKLQTLENGIYRQILGGRSCTPIAILRGEVGSSMVITRVIQSWLVLAKSILVGENILLKQVLGNIMRTRKGCWFITFTKYLETIGISYNNFVEMDISEIKAKIREYDNKLWFDNLGDLTDRDVYKKFKSSVGRSFGYDNRFESDLLFKARSNDLDLNIFKRHTGGDIACVLCGAVREDLEHFLFNCQKLERVRDRTLIDRIAMSGDSVDRIGNLLFCKTYVEEVKMQLGRLWRERNTLLIIANRPRA